MNDKGKIHHMDDYRISPTLVIHTHEANHVYPMSYFHSIIRGEPVEPIPEDVLRVIVREWLELTVTNLFEDD